MLNFLKKHRNKLVPILTGVVGVVAGEPAKSLVSGLLAVLGL